jgi:hypothetical protein
MKSRWLFVFLATMMLPRSQALASVTTQTSPTWSGYVVTAPGGSVTDVKGSWKVPTAQCGLFSLSKTSLWVGMDGDGNTTVEQIGTHSNCNSFVPQYDAWYEFFPGNQVRIKKLKVSPGDVISAEVSYDTETALFTVSITDETTGQSYSASAASSSAFRASAEWIAEDPEYKFDGKLYPYALTDFGTVGYGEDDTGVTNTGYAAIGSQSGPIGSFGADGTQVYRVVLSNNGNAAVPSSLSSDGSSFSVKWEGGTVFLDKFTNDSILSSDLWTTSSSFLTNLARGTSSPPGSFVSPQLTFSKQIGMQMSGLTEEYTFTGVQSLSTFSAPFTVVTQVTPTQGTANPFLIDLVSADFTQFFTLHANVNPVYQGFWANAPDMSALWQLGEQFSPSIVPELNTVYTIVLSVDATGAASAQVKSSGKVLGTLSGLQPGVGPFYLVLGQRIGLASSGSQVADWSQVRVTTP